MAAKKKNLQNSKIRKLFFSAFIPLMTLALAAGGFFYKMTSTIIEYYVKSETSATMEKVSALTLEILKPATINLNNLAEFAGFIDDVNSIDGITKAFANGTPGSKVFYFATEVPRQEPKGIFSYSGDWTPPDEWDPRTRSWYINAKNSPAGTLIFTDPYIDSADGEITATISLGSYTPEGHFIGVAGADFSLTRIADIIDNAEITKNSIVSIITSAGSYIATTDSTKTLDDNYFESAASYIPPKEEFLNGIEADVNFTKKNFYGVVQIAGTPWYVVLEGPLADYKGTLEMVINFALVVMLVFSFIASIGNLITVKNVRKNDREIGTRLFDETQNLVVASKETSATSQDQSAAVKEIVATMEDSNALSENISNKIKDVSKVAMKTSGDVADGVASIEKNVEQLHAIFDANQQTIEGMKILSEKIESIWDIVSLINNVADQAKIIAFNAELEATSAGEAGKSFRIVANEIRRLSDGIIDGTKEIKEKITEIQHSSDSLILASESGTEKINAGYDNAKDLGFKFASIKSSSEITATSAQDITEIIQQQAIASEQILIALKQISAGVESFTVATGNISNSAENLRELSEELNSSIQVGASKNESQEISE